jgi:predicted enzyme related to lactoylglutathione lyase
MNEVAEANKTLGHSYQLAGDTKAALKHSELALSTFLEINQAMSFLKMADTTESDDLTAKIGELKDLISKLSFLRTVCRQRSNDTEAPAGHSLGYKGFLCRRSRRPHHQLWWPSGRLINSRVERAMMAKITGIGGVFFKSRNDNAALTAWYQKHLGMQLESWGGAILRWPDDKAEDKGLTVWHVAGKDSQWFSPSDSSFMINYRVDNLDEMVAQLREGGIEIIKGPDSDANGKFAWIMDPDGNKVELWEPMLVDDKNENA